MHKQFEGRERLDIVKLHNESDMWSCDWLRLPRKHGQKEQGANPREGLEEGSRAYGMGDS